MRPLTGRCSEDAERWDGRAQHARSGERDVAMDGITHPFEEGSSDTADDASATGRSSRVDDPETHRMSSPRPTRKPWPRFCATSERRRVRWPRGSSADALRVLRSGRFDPSGGEAAKSKSSTPEASPTRKPPADRMAVQQFNCTGSAWARHASSSRSECRVGSGLVAMRWSRDCPVRKSPRRAVLA